MPPLLDCDDESALHSDASLGEVSESLSAEDEEELEAARVLLLDCRVLRFGFLLLVVASLDEDDRSDELKVLLLLLNSALNETSLSEFESRLLGDARFGT